MAIEHHSVTNNATSNKNGTHSVNQHFSLERLLAKTALADIYLAHDQGEKAVPNRTQRLILLVNPMLAQQPGFQSAWEQTLLRPAPPAAAYPDISGYGQHQGEYWLALNNAQGSLLVERLSELDDRGLPLDTALDTLESISHALSGIQAGPFGYMEPGAILQTGQDYKILNAPLVKILQKLALSNTSNINKLALHSPHISPSVAVGDSPVTEDDTFSAATLLYALLTGKLPFGDRSTLAAVAHGDKPVKAAKLKKDSWELLENALSFQRRPRPENPDKLFKAVRKANRRKIIFPIAVLAALGVAAYAGNHLITQLGGFIQPPDTKSDSQAQKSLAQQPESTATATPEADANTAAQTTQAVQSLPVTAAIPTEDKPLETATTETARVIPETNEPVVQQDKAVTDTTDTATSQETIEVTTAETEAAQATSEVINADNETETTQAIRETALAVETAPDNSDTPDTPTTDQLLERAEAAIAADNIEGNADNPGALTFFRQIEKLDKGSKQSKALLNQIIEQTLGDADRLIKEKSFQQAQERLQDSDKIIREFTLTNQLQKQVRLESKLTIIRQEQEQVNALLLKAKDAIQLGNLTKDDASTDYALLHLNNVMFKQPGNPDGLALLGEVARLRQQAARTALADDELEQAGTYLSESQRLIRKYELNELEAEQNKLDEAYTSSATQSATTSSPAGNNADDIEVLDLTPEATVSNTIAPSQQSVPSNSAATANTGTDTAIISTTPSVASNPDSLPAETTGQTTAQTLPVEQLPVNEIGIQESTLDDPLINAGAEPLTPNQIFVPEALPNTVDSLQAIPIWEQNAVDNNQPIQGTVQQPAIIFEPPVAPLPSLTTPQTAVIQPPPAVNYETAQPQQQAIIPQQARPVSAQEVFTYQPEQTQAAATAQPPLNSQQPDLPVVQFNAPALSAETLPNNLPIIEQFTAYETLPENSPALNSPQEVVPLEMIPELEEIPIYEIEEILPAAN